MSAYTARPSWILCGLGAMSELPSKACSESPYIRLDALENTIDRPSKIDFDRVGTGNASSRCSAGLDLKEIRRASGCRVDQSPDKNAGTRRTGSEAADFRG